MATPKYKENFPLFDELAPMIPTECREEVRKIMQLLENVWRDDLCKATIVISPRVSARRTRSRE